MQPKLVNRPSKDTLHRPCDLATATTRRHRVVQQRCTIAQTAEAETESRNHENAPENAIATQQTALSRMSTNTSTLQRPLHNSRYLWFSTMLPLTPTRTTNGNTSWALPKILQKELLTHTLTNLLNAMYIHVEQPGPSTLTQTHTCEGAPNFVKYTWRTDTRKHQSSVSNPRRKHTHEICPSHDVRPQNKTHIAQTPPRTQQLCFAVRCCTSRYSTKPHTQTLFVQ